MTRLAQVLHDFDDSVYRKAVRTKSKGGDRALYLLTRAADKSLLWAGASLALATLGGRRSKRAAARGMVSVALTSFLVNLPIKFLARRRRPDPSSIPRHRRVVRLPTTYSFPSGHSASAAAFATGVALELPVLGIPAAAAAAGVAYSRVHFGVHYPSDVIAGAGIGAAIALAAVRLWVPEELAQTGDGPAARPLRLEPSPKGQGVFVAVNPSSGPVLSKDPTQQVISILPRAEVTALEQGVDLQRLLTDASSNAIAIGVAGGDGSVRSGAEVAVKTEKPFLLLPAGTLNHLARDLGLQSASDALGAVRKGQAAAIDAATLDGKLFFNTASIGGYVDLVETRDRLESKIGKWPAGAVALTKVLRRSPPIDLEIDGRSVKVWMVFVGNCRYEPAGLAPARRPRLDDGMLDVRLFHARGPWGKLRLLIAALRGTLAADPLYEGYLTRDLTINSPGGPIKVACDGETFDVPGRLEIQKLPAALKIYAPIEPEKTAGAR